MCKPADLKGAAEHCNGQAWPQTAAAVVDSNSTKVDLYDSGGRPPLQDGPGRDQGEYTSTDSGVDDSIIRGFERNVRVKGDRCTFTWLDTQAKEVAVISFVELRAQALSVCYALLREWSVQESDRVLLIHPPGLEFISAFLGCLYAKVTAVPYYPPVFPPTLMPGAAALKQLTNSLNAMRRVVDCCSPSLILTTSSFLRAKLLSTPILIRDGLKWPAIPTHASDDLPPQRTKPAEAEWLGELVDKRSAEPAGSRPPIFLQFTSGSTGNPKGVIVSEANAVANVRAMFYSTTPEVQALFPKGVMRFVNWVPQYHDMGLLTNIMGPLLVGMHSDLMSPLSFLQRPQCWLEAISRRHGTSKVMTVAPNFSYALAARKVPASARASLNLEHLVMTASGGEAIRWSTICSFNEAFTPCGFRPEAWQAGYGLAENVFYVAGTISAPEVVKLESANLKVGGKPLLRSASEGVDVVDSVAIVLQPAEVVGWSVAIHHPETFEPVPEGCVGEVWISGVGVTGGYWGNKESTAETFTLLSAGSAEGESQRYLRTGDLGLIVSGRLHIVGRIKDMMVVNGRNLHAHDIEASAEAACSELRPGCSAAISVSHGAEDEQLVLVAEVRSTYPLAKLEQIVSSVCAAVRREHGAAEVGSVMLLQPKSILKTTSGKLRRRACREAYLQLLTVQPKGAALTCATQRKEGAAGRVWSTLFASRPKRTAADAAMLIPPDRVLHFWMLDEEDGRV